MLCVFLVAFYLRNSHRLFIFTGSHIYLHIQPTTPPTRPLNQQPTALEEMNDDDDANCISGRVVYAMQLTAHGVAGNERQRLCELVLDNGRRWCCCCNKRLNKRAIHIKIRVQRIEWIIISFRVGKEKEREYSNIIWINTGTSTGLNHHSNS